MPGFSLPAPTLAGLVCALPATSQANADLGERFGAETMRKIIASTGITERPVATGQTVSDLATAAANSLLDGLGWERNSIDLLIVVTQTPDRPLPATACILQQRLTLAMTTAAFDLGLGCSGFVYGLSVVASMLACGAAKRALLVAGDISSLMIGSDDRALLPLFGDAVAVAALERGAETGNSISFDLGTDGAGAPYLISATGGTVSPGAPRLFMDGPQVMAFALKQVEPSIRRVLALGGHKIAEADHVVLHQANAMMLQRLGDKIGATPEQLVLALSRYGNTSSASIPLALAECLSGGTADRVRLLLSGFGVGWSWASAWWDTARPGVCGILRCSL
jgi:3-oxoacyl-[acyl-carrier-protein] synthase-3